MIALHVAARELRGLFLSPLGWVALGAAQIIVSWFAFAPQVFGYEELAGRFAGAPGLPSLSQLVVRTVGGTAAALLLLVGPLVTMRAFSEERRAGTLTLLRSSPLSMLEVVVGKYLASCGFLASLLALIALMPASLLLGGAVDLGLVAAAFAGLVMLGSAVAAAGVCLSTFTASPAVAAMSTLGLLYVLWILPWTGATGEVADVLEYLSPSSHLERPLRGVLDTRDIAYFALFTAAFLGLAVHRLDLERTQR